jgi:hypothetical protein
MNLQVRIQKAFGHFLHSRIVVAPLPHAFHSIKLQVTTLDWTMIFFANITQPKNAPSHNGPNSALAFSSRRCADGEAHCIPSAIRGRPAAIGGVAKIAASFQRRLRGRFALVTGSGAVAAPSAAERQPGGMGPRAILKSLSRHEIRAGHRLSRPGIVGTRHCNQKRRLWPTRISSCELRV